jgi:putative ABC transport system permease protein
MSIYLRVAVRNLVQARRRTLLLSVALAFVSMLLVLLMALSAGITHTMLRSSTALVTGHVNVGGFYKAKPGDYYPLLVDVTKVRQIVTDTLDKSVLSYVVDRDRGWGRIVSETGNMNVSMSGVDITEDRALVSHIQLAKESEYKDGGSDQILGRIEDLAAPDTAMLFAGQAKRLGINVGDTVTITSETLSGAVNTYDVKVVAIARDIGFMSGWNLYVEKSVIRNLYQLRPDTSGVVMVYLHDVAQSEEVLEQLHAAFKKADFEIMERQRVPFFQKFSVVGGEDWLGQKLDLTTWEDEIAYAKWAINALDSMTAMLIGILLVIIAVGITNTMWIAVRERTQEIGTLRAIGMGKRQVQWMFLVESGLLGAFATTVGCTAGALVALAVDWMAPPIEIDAIRAVLMSNTLHLVVAPWPIVRAILLFTWFTTMAAFWPARRAAQLQPVTAIHRVG